VALALGLVHYWNKRFSLSSIHLNPIYGVFLGTALLGFATGLATLSPTRSPNWADYSAAGWFFPFLGTGLGPVLSYITQCTVVLVLVSSLAIFTNRLQKRKLLGTGILILVGLVFAGSSGISAVWSWLLVGLLLGLLFWLSFRFIFSYQMAAVLPAVAALLIGGIAREASYTAYPGALPGYCMAALLVAGIALLWYRQLTRSEQ
jgi:hypothetical protein